MHFRYKSILYFRITHLLVATFCITLYSFSYYRQYSYASYGVTIKPAVIEIKTSSRSPITQEINLKNLSADQMNYTFDFRELKSTGQEVSFAENSPMYIKLFKNISILENNQAIEKITLPGNTEKTIIIKIDPLDIANHDYYFSVLAVSEIKSHDAGPNSITSLSYGAGNIILLRLGQAQDPIVAIEKFDIKTFNTKGPISIKAVISNKGKGYTEASGRIKIKNMFGTVVDSITLAPQILLPGQLKTMYPDSVRGNTILPQKDKSDQENYQSFDWNDNFLYGLYTAEISLHTSENSTEVLAEKKFVVLPLLSVIPVILILLLCIRFYLRVKERILSK